MGLSADRNIVASLPGEIKTSASNLQLAINLVNSIVSTAKEASYKNVNLIIKINLFHSVVMETTSVSKHISSQTLTLKKFCFV